jgi:hypothetical protein
MLPPFIIEQIRKREEERQTRQEQAVLELPLPHPMQERSGPRVAPPSEDEPRRGVIVIDL